MPTTGRPGRPRDPRAQRAVLEATIHLLGDRGVAAMSVEAVAERAGVGKATIYRRWASKEALCVEAVACVVLDAPAACAGDPRRGLSQLLTGLERALETSDVGRLLPHLASVAATNPQLAAIWRQSLVEPTHERVTALLARAVDAGQLAVDIDRPLAAELLLAPFFYRLLVSGAPARPDAVDRLLAVVWATWPGPATGPFTPSQRH